MHCVDLGESFPNSNEYLLAKFGFDTAENEPCKVCPLSAYRSPRYRKNLIRRVLDAETSLTGAIKRKPYDATLIHLDVDTDSD